MRHGRVSPLAFVLILMLISLAGLIVGGSSGVIRANAAPGDAAVPAAYPAFVFSGHCASLGLTPRFTLADVTVTTVYGNPKAVDRAPAGSDLLPVTLADLLAEPYAIVIRGGIGDTAETLACGDIDRMATEGRLAVGLQEQNRSGFAGIARLRGERGQTHLTVFLAEGLAGTASARKSAWAMAAAPGCGCAAARDPNASEATVAITDSLFVPGPLQVQTGATVTWVNAGSADHTVTVFHAGKLVTDSDVLPVGRSFTHSFHEPGTYDYLSTLDESMRGRVVVAGEQVVAALNAFAMAGIR